MKLVTELFFLILVVAAHSGVGGGVKCPAREPELPTTWVDLGGDCLAAMRRQIQMEIDACYTYLAMGAHFSRDTSNRRGFAELFFQAAREERGHGRRLIEYLSMRGRLTANISGLIAVPAVEQHEWVDGAAALEDALRLEAEVTKSIRGLIETCEKEPHHHHLVDHLAGVFLAEQLHAQRDLAGKLSSLKKMRKMRTGRGALGEFLFDLNLGIQQN